MLSMHQSQRDNPTALLFAVVALIALAAWLSDVRGADARSLDLYRSSERWNSLGPSSRFVGPAPNRALGKICLGSKTRVLTNHGVKQIVDELNEIKLTLSS